MSCLLASGPSANQDPGSSPRCIVPSPLIGHPQQHPELSVGAGCLMSGVRRCPLHTDGSQRRMCCVNLTSMVMYPSCARPFQGAPRLMGRRLSMSTTYRIYRLPLFMTLLAYVHAVSFSAPLNGPRPLDAELWTLNRCSPSRSLDEAYEFVFRGTSSFSGRAQMSPDAKSCASPRERLATGGRGATSRAHSGRGRRRQR